MPIEIKELIIKASVDASAASGSSSENNQSDIVQECVEEVLRILKEREKEA